METENKIQYLKLKNVVVQTFHGFFQSFYKSEGDQAFGNDLVLKKSVLNYEKQKRLKSYRPDYLIIDEFQDFRDLYFQALMKWKTDFLFKGKFVVLGDQN